MAQTPVARPNDAGNAKMPDSTIDPITSAMSAARELPISFVRRWGHDGERPSSRT
jgi:hypothetical protein